MARVTRRVREQAPRTKTPNLAPRRLLLDTHVWLWWQADDNRLGPTARRYIATAREIRFSAASAWEIAIKCAIGKLTLPKNADIESELERDGFVPLSVDIAHADAVRTLPALHRDPFDRLLVAQALVEGLTIVTGDPDLTRYDVPVVDATS
jgi:PIN domain nuclease of toxin-antitoxin system